MLQISPSEMLIIAGAAFLFLGPRKLMSTSQEIRKIYEGIAKVKRQTREAIDDILQATELDTISKDVANIHAEMVRLNSDAQSVPFQHPRSKMH